MKKMKKIMAAALAMMTFSTAAAVTGTVAWFTANNLVNVGGMTVKAEAEQGIVVSNEGKSEWKTSATASHTGAGIGFVPTSTKTASAWYHGFAANAANGQEYESIEAITPVDNTTVSETAYGTAGDGAYGFFDTSAWKHVYLLNSFYIQSSSINAINGQDIFVRDFSATTASQELSKALRVAVVKHGTSNAQIIAPVAGATLSYQVGPTDAKVATTAIAAANTNVNTIELEESVNIPAYNASGTGALQYDVFVYFEGEDVACKSNNIVAELEELTVSFKFGNKVHD